MNRISQLSKITLDILTDHLRVTTSSCDYPPLQSNASKTPAATAEPITPDTFGPMACISR